MEIQRKQSNATLSEKLDTIIELLRGLPSLLSGAVVVPQSACAYDVLSWLNEWFTLYKKPNLKDKGYDMGHTIDKHIKPHIPNKPLNQITAADITRALNQVGSERMRQVVYSYYNQMFNKAVEVGIVDEKQNPMRGVDSVAHEYETGLSLTKQQQLEFLCEAKKDREFYPLFQFYLLSGARPSEPLSMRWDYVTKDSFRIKGTKTKTSDRRLPLFPEVAKLFAKIPRKTERIFPFTYERVRAHFNEIRDRVSFRVMIENGEAHEFTIKDLRHTFGTRCIESGVNIKTLQKWLGHSNYKTTESIYTHITTEFEQEEIAKFNQNISLLKPPKKCL